MASSLPLRSFGFLAALVALIAIGSGAGAAPPTQSGEFFEKRVRPLLQKHCVACHSGADARGGLDMRSRESLLKGGALGPAVAPGDVDASLLVRAVRYDGNLKMPPRGKLSAGEVRDLEQWVRDGAAWPGAPKPVAAAPRPGPQGGGKKPEPLWSLRPVKPVKPPDVKARAWVRTPIDSFILARLEAAGLKPNPQVDRRTLIRRATFDLTGLPPTPEEVAAFLADSSTEAWERVVDRLLASPAYGERWGRHWLDVARYADSNGQDENLIFGAAWRYRDWVVRVLNEDRPYDRFIREQLAGDLLPHATQEELNENLVATGFLMLGPKVLAEPDKAKLLMDVVDEQIDVTTRAFLGLSVSCARCHDHKFDPIATRDYYALAGIFKSTTTIHTDGGIVSRWHERALAAPEVVSARAQHSEAVRKLQAQMREAKDPAEKERLAAEVKALEAKAPPAAPMAMAVQEGRVDDVRVHIRGNHLTLGDPVPRGFAVSGGPRLRLETSQSGRLELAAWIASEDNPLTARVAVNRVWQGHFGRGLVASPDDFGTRGEKPTHPELLDWLASAFARGDYGDEPRARPWSLKPLHRLIMLSSTYRMSGAHSQTAAGVDPENRLRWRWEGRRLEVEAIRDAVLAVSGKLDTSIGGAGYAGRSGYATNDQSGNVAGYETARRSIYLPVNRNAVFDMFAVFDFVDPNVPSGRRDVTTVAPQALYMLNSPFVTEQAGHFATALLRGPGEDAERITAAYQTAFARPPNATERARALRFLDSFTGQSQEQDAAARRRAAWAAFCHSLLASSEFSYLN